MGLGCCPLASPPCKSTFNSPTLRRFLFPPDLLPLSPPQGDAHPTTPTGSTCDSASAANVALLSVPSDRSGSAAPRPKGPLASGCISDEPLAWALGFFCAEEQQRKRAAGRVRERRVRKKQVREDEASHR